MAAAIDARERAAMALGSMIVPTCCSKNPVATRNVKLYSTVGAVFLDGAGEWTLAMECCWLCHTLAGRWPRAVHPRRLAQGTHWDEWAPAAPRTATACAHRLDIPSFWERRAR